MNYRLVFPMVGTQVGSTCPTGSDFGTLLGYTPGDVKIFDAVVGANSAGLMIRNPLGAEGVKI